MNVDKDSLSFGRYLQAMRLEKKISLEQVAEQTRIGLGNLLLIEQEDLEQLPAEVFVKGFLRAYAAAVGADGDEAVRRYESRLGVVHKIAESEASVGRTETRLFLKLMLSLAMLLCIIAVSILAISFLHQSPETKALPRQKLSTAENQSETSEGRGNADISQESSDTDSEILALRIKAVENTWIKVIIDENESTEYNLKAGEEIELEAAKGYNLLIGDAGGVALTLNNKPVSIPGESGQVVTMHLP